MTTPTLRPLTTQEIAFNANRSKQLDIIASFDATLVKKTKVYDSIFSKEIPNFLKNKN